MVGSHEFKVQNVKARVSNPRVMACLNLEPCKKSSKLQGLDPFSRYASSNVSGALMSLGMRETG